MQFRFTSFACLKRLFSKLYLQTWMNPRWKSALYWLQFFSLHSLHVSRDSRKRSNRGEGRSFSIFAFWNLSQSLSITFHTSERNPQARIRIDQKPEILRSRRELAERGKRQEGEERKKKRKERNSRRWESRSQSWNVGLVCNGAACAKKHAGTCNTVACGSLWRGKTRKENFPCALIKSLPLIFTRFSVFFCHVGEERERERERTTTTKKWKGRKTEGRKGGKVFLALYERRGRLSMREPRSWRAHEAGEKGGSLSRFSRLAAER